MSMSPFRILIVDDSVDSARALQILLKGEGYDARAEYSGPSAIKEAARFLPNIMLIDLSMPGMDGVELATQCRGMPDLEGCRLVAVTGYGKEAIPVPSPFDQYIQKPVDHAAFLNYVAIIANR